MQSDGLGEIEMFYLFQSPSSYLFQSFYFQQGYPSQAPKAGTPTSTGNRNPQGQQTPSAGPASLGYPSQPQKPGTPSSTGNAQNFPSLPSPSSGSGSIGTPSSSGNQSPTGGKTFAQVASGGTNPGSPASTPKQGVLTVNGQGGRVGGQASSGGTQPGEILRLS